MGDYAEDFEDFEELDGHKSSGYISMKETVSRVHMNTDARSGKKKKKPINSTRGNKVLLTPKRHITSMSPSFSSPHDRIISSKVRTIASLQNQLSEAKAEVAELKKENKILNRIQARQEKDLSKYESKEGDFPQILQGHSEELRMWKNKVKRLQDLLESSRRLAEGAQYEADRLKERNRKLESTNKKKHLEEREELSSRLRDVTERLQDRDKHIADLEHAAQLQVKTHQHEVRSQQGKNRALHSEVDQLRQACQQFRRQIREKEKEIEVKNIYVQRMPRNIPKLLPRLPSTCDISLSTDLTCAGSEDRLALVNAQDHRSLQDRTPKSRANKSVEGRSVRKVLNPSTPQSLAVLETAAALTPVSQDRQPEPSLSRTEQSNDGSPAVTPLSTRTPTQASTAPRHTTTSTSTSSPSAVTSGSGGIKVEAPFIRPAPPQSEPAATTPATVTGTALQQQSPASSQPQATNEQTGFTSGPVVPKSPDSSPATDPVQTDQTPRNSHPSGKEQGDLSEPEPPTWLSKDNQAKFSESKPPSWLSSNSSKGTSLQSKDPPNWLSSGREDKPVEQEPPEWQSGERNRDRLSEQDTPKWLLGDGGQKAAKTDHPESVGKEKRTEQSTPTWLSSDSRKKATDRNAPTLLSSEHKDRTSRRDVPDWLSQDTKDKLPGQDTLKRFPPEKESRNIAEEQKALLLSKLQAIDNSEADPIIKPVTPPSSDTRPQPTLLTSTTLPQGTRNNGVAVAMDTAIGIVSSSVREQSNDDATIGGGPYGARTSAKRTSAGLKSTSQTSSTGSSHSVHQWPNTVQNLHHGRPALATDGDPFGTRIASESLLRHKRTSGSVLSKDTSDGILAGYKPKFSRRQNAASGAPSGSKTKNDSSSTVTAHGSDDDTGLDVLSSDSGLYSWERKVDVAPTHHQQQQQRSQAKGFQPAPPLRGPSHPSPLLPRRPPLPVQNTLVGGIMPGALDDDIEELKL